MILTSGKNFAVDIGLETFLQACLALDIALDSGERLQTLRYVGTFLGLHLLNKLAAIEGSKSLFGIRVENLTLPTVEEEIIEFVHVHLDIHVDVGILVGPDGGSKVGGIHKFPETILHVAE